MTSSIWITTIVTLVLMCHHDVMGQVPTGCTLDNGLFQCDYRFATPLLLTDFSPQPQRLVLYNVDGGIDDTLLVDFNLMNATAFDDNYDAELTVSCLQGGGELILTSNSFESMSYWKSVQITNCEIADLPSRAFSNFLELNYLGIQGGSIAQVQSNALGGLVIRRDPKSVAPKGELSIVDVEFPNNEFPTGFLVPQISLHSLKIHKSGLNNVTVDFLSHIVNLTSLSLDNNDFTSLPLGLFDDLKSLTTFHAGGINWECSCSNLWWITYVSDNGMMITSEMLCHTPTGYYGQKAAMFFTNACVSGLICDQGTLPAVNLANVTCLTYLQIVVYVFAVIAFIGLSLLFCCWVHTRRQLNRMDGASGGGNKAAMMRRVSGGNNRVAGAPRGRQAPPNIKGGWH